MGQVADDAETILIFYGSFVKRVARVVFRHQPYLSTIYPNAVGFINYDRNIGAVHRSPAGELYVDISEHVLREFPPLSRRTISD